MKNSLIIAITLLTFAFGFAQNNKAEAILIEKKILNKSKKIGDPTIATASLYRLIALEGENSTYKDSLAYVYFSARKYAPCFMIANEVLQRDPNHVEMLEIKGISLEALGAISKASDAYKQLFAITNDNYHGYTLAKLDYTLKKYNEANATILKTEKLNDAGKYKVTFTINQNHNQQVELLAAISYLKGLISTELDKKDIAKISFEKAIKIQSDFILAKEHLEALEK